jgi:hypothetical protein
MSSLESQAMRLTSPNSGLASDYLNHFNEVLLAIENLPLLLPDMVDELIAWKPVSYRAYFEQSNLPGRAEALQIYDTLDDDFRREVEAMIRLLDSIIVESISIIVSYRGSDGVIKAEDVEKICGKLASVLRMVIEKMVDLVNYGYASPLEQPQEMADRILDAMPLDGVGLMPGEELAASMDGGNARAGARY